MKASQTIPAAMFFVFVIAIFIFIVHGRQRYNERFGVQSDVRQVILPRISPPPTVEISASVLTYGAIS